jgi:hypothetical protein
MNHARTISLIESGAHATIAEYFHAMFPRDYKWRGAFGAFGAVGASGASGAHGAQGWSRRVIDGGKVHWEPMSEHSLTIRVTGLMCELLRRMKEARNWTEAQTREAHAALGGASRVIAKLRCMYEDSVYTTL